jgi:hypothetical protein
MTFTRSSLSRDKKGFLFETKNDQWAYTFLYPVVSSVKNSIGRPAEENAGNEYACYSNSEDSKRSISSW